MHNFPVAVVSVVITLINFMPDTNPSPEVVEKVSLNSESFGTLPKDAEAFRTIPKVSEHRENHTLTIREVARMFEAAGVARTERSIINWCQPNRQGVPRLDSYFDPNERRYFISPQSVELAIKEEQAKAAKNSESAESVGSVPKPAERGREAGESPVNGEPQEIRALQREIMDLKITNKAKDMFIERLQQERGDFVERLVISSHRIGELETKVLQLQAPQNQVEGEVQSSAPQ